MERPTAHTKRALLASVVATALVLLTVISPAVAQGDDGVVQWIGQLPSPSSVDDRGDPVTVSLLSKRYDQALSDVSATEAGESITVAGVTSAVASGQPVELVYVIDVGSRMAVDDTLSSVGRAIAEAVSGLPGTVRVGVVTAGTNSQQLVPLTSNSERLDRALRDLNVGRGSAIYDAMASASDTFSDAEGVARSVVLITGGGDVGSTVSRSEAMSGLLQRGVQVIAVDSRSSEAFEEMAASTGGIYSSVETLDQLPLAIAPAQAIASDRLLISMDSSAPAGVRVPLTISVENVKVEISYPTGVYTVSQAQLEVPEASRPGASAFWSSRAVMLASVLLAFATIAIVVWAVGSMFMAGGNDLDSLLADYTEDGDHDEAEIREAFVKSTLVRRASDLAESIAEDRGVRDRVEAALERADIPMRAGEALSLLGASSLGVFFIVWIASKSFLMALVFAALVAAIGYFSVGFLTRRRLKKFEGQLPDTLEMLAGTLRAGYSLPQGLAAVAEEIDDPMGHELGRVITENQLGRDIDSALGAMADRLKSDDFAWVVMAISIQREVGGNLNELLITVSETMVERQRLHRDVSALTAEGRVSAGILSMLPPGLGLVLWIMNPDYVNILFSRTIGLGLLAAAVVSAAIGLMWMKKVITIDA